jgi:hypothetical protein
LRGISVCYVHICCKLLRPNVRCCELANSYLGHLPASPTTGSLFQYIQALKWSLVNQVSITDANGSAVFLKDDSLTQAANITNWVTDNSTTTVRLKVL